MAANLAAVNKKSLSLEKRYRVHDMKFFTIVYLIYQLYDAYIRTEFSLWLINIKLFKSFKDFKIQTDLFRYFKGS